MDAAHTPREDLARTLENVRRLIAVRQKELAEAETLVLKRVRRQDITLLNPISRKMHVNFMQLMSATLQLDCKMARRCLFYLRARERMLLEELARLGEAGGGARGEGEGPDTDTVVGAGGSAA